jgi:amino-acid N-acetyltransferase
MSELYSQVKDFIVSEDKDSGEIVGCGALQIVWEDLAEIRSLAVQTDHQGKGIGTALIEALLEESKQMGVGKVFVLTYRPELFQRLGFELMDRSLLPHKIWADCIRCTKFPECDEIALVRAS